MIAADPTPNLWRIAFGVIFIILWVLIHVGLFYLIAAGGIVSEILLGIIRSILFPGTAHTAQPEHFTWVPALRIALSLTGLSGLPLGLTFFLAHGRNLLLLISAVAFVLGLLAGISALIGFVSDAASVVSFEGVFLSHAKYR